MPNNAHFQPEKRRSGCILRVQQIPLARGPASGEETLSDFRTDCELSVARCCRFFMLYIKLSVQYTHHVDFGMIAGKLSIVFLYRGIDSEVRGCT